MVEMVGSPFKGYDHMLSSVPKAHFHRLGRNIYSLHASGVPSQKPFFIVWDGTFMTRTLPSSVPKALFRRLGRNIYSLHASVVPS